MVVSHTCITTIQIEPRTALSTMKPIGKKFSPNYPFTMTCTILLPSNNKNTHDLREVELFGMKN